MISLTIPYYESDPGKRQILEKCIASMKGYDELIIVSGRQESLSKAVNMCLSFAHGDYIIVSNDDVVLKEGTLDLLCIPGAVSQPKVISGLPKAFHAHMFCIPRDIYTNIGGWDESFTGIYWEDADYHMKLVSANIPVVTIDSVVLLHEEPGRTIKMLPHTGTEEINKKLFYEKWGDNGLRVTGNG